MRPPVLIIGAQRSATTYLYRALDRHADVVMARPERPEPKWFLRPEAADGTAADWHGACFDVDCADDTVFGEKSTSYIDSDIAATRISRTLPEAHIVVCLRDPVQRALSNYRFSVVNGVEQRGPATALLSGQEPAWDPLRFSVSPYDYLGRSRYIDQFPRWDGVGEALHVVLSEQLVAEPAVMEGLVQAIGLQSSTDRLRPAARVNATADGPSVGRDVVAAVRERLAGSTAALVDQFDLPFARWWSSVG